MGPEFWVEHFPLDAAVESTQNWLGFHAHYCYKNVKMNNWSLHAL